ncbi:glycosyltransferase family 1 protein [Ruoffia tabacinasalis]|uniref:Glycosyltransferase family 1 protein n=1 Tax=Ruoffia tabacinasalis TaxID=87458 RepID=A0A5R9DUB5_9LACT|nr:glycosyltransferase family 1 protein [Ruoffia tabacinasalis]TLQ39885.1 glycosyltransferase family 1 protein [Ruoffia tabacinasalis]
MNNKIRILHVFSVMDRGGAETMIMEIFRKIDKSLFQFDFIVHTEKAGAYDEEIKKLGGKIYRVPRYNGKNHFQYIKRWNNFLKNKHYHIIHGHVRSTASIYLSIAKKNKILTISHSHSTSNGKNISSIFKNLLQLPIRVIADCYLAASKDAGIWLFGKTIVERDNFFILKNSIEAKRYSLNNKIRNEYRNNLDIQDQFVIGHIGSFKGPKNHLFLIEIFNIVQQKNADSILLLVGDGEERPSILKKITEFGLKDKVILTGIRSDIPNLLQAFDVFVFPSLFEGFGIVAVEAQTAGVPIIVSDEIPKEAFLTDLIESVSLKEKAEFWADSILNYVDNIKTSDRVVEIINSGYDIGEAVHQLQNIYIKLLNNNKTNF